MKKYFKALCIILIALTIAVIFNYYYFFSPNIPYHLKSIPHSEQERLGDFFEELIINQGFGYTLFGNKPVIWAVYFARPSVNGILLEEKSGVVLRKGIHTWLTYKNLFPSKNFIIKFHENQKIGSIYLINKSAFLAKVEENIELFRQILGPMVTAKSLLEKFERKNTDLSNILKNHDGLLGILLGFGTQNSMNFQRYTELDAALHGSVKIPFKSLCDENLLSLTPSQKVSLNLNRQMGSKAKQQQKIFPSRGFQSIHQEYEYLQTKLLPTHTSFPLQKFSPPVFRADLKSEETKIILASYKETRKKLAHIYTEGNFLEITLLKVTGY